MPDVRVFAFHPGLNRWYRLVSDDEGRQASVEVDKSEIGPGDLRTTFAGDPSMVGIAGVTKPKPPADAPTVTGPT